MRAGVEKKKHPDKTTYEGTNRDVAKFFVAQAKTWLS